MDFPIFFHPSPPCRLCQGDQVDVGASLFSVQKQLADAEEADSGVLGEKSMEKYVEKI